MDAQQIDEALGSAVGEAVPRNSAVVTLEYDDSCVSSHNEASAALLRDTIQEYVERWRQSQEIDFPYEGIWAAFALKTNETPHLHVNVDRYIAEIHRVTPLRVEFKVYAPACLRGPGETLIGVKNAYVVHIVDIT